jgi:ATP-dependent RNA helicase DDX18/HAS1
LLFLLESELGFLRYLKEAKVPLNEYTFPKEKIANVQSQLEKLLQKNYFLHQSAKDGFRSYLQAYASYSHKKIYDVNKLDLVKVGKSFGFSVPPRVSLNMAGSGKSSNGPASSAPKKRKRGTDAGVDEEQEGEWLDMDTGRHGDGEAEDDVEERSAPRGRGAGKSRRMETLGKKKVQKEVYKKGTMNQGDGTTWSR